MRRRLSNESDEPFEDDAWMYLRKSPYERCREDAKLFLVVMLSIAMKICEYGTISRSETIDKLA